MMNFEGYNYLVSWVLNKILIVILTTKISSLRLSIQMKVSELPSLKSLRTGDIAHSDLQFLSLDASPEGTALLCAQVPSDRPG